MSDEGLKLIARLEAVIGHDAVQEWLQAPNITLFGMKPIWFIEMENLGPLWRIVRQLELWHNPEED